MDAASGLEWPEDGRPAAVALEFPARDPATPLESAPSRAPRRLRRRGTGKSAPTSAEEIEAKLREADLRRQKFHEGLSSKARLKIRSPSLSSQDEDLSQRVEGKLCAAEQKRLSLLQKAEMRLARLDELPQAAETGAEMGLQKERKELGTQAESRIQPGVANRKAVIQDRKAEFLIKRINEDTIYKDLTQVAIYQQRAAAEQTRFGLLVAEKTQAHANVMRARRVAKSTFHQGEMERRRMKEDLEERLQRAKRQRAEYLRQRGSPRSSCDVLLNEKDEHDDFLSRKLALCWRWFVKFRKTTFSLAKSFETLKLNGDLVKSMPFEQLAHCIESPETLETVGPFLDRLESYLKVLLSANPSGPENIDHLLKRMSSSNKRASTDKQTPARGSMKKLSKKELKMCELRSPLRYPVRLVLCAYMILGHPGAVFSGHGEHEIRLTDSATRFIREFDLLVRIILNSPNSISSSRLSSPDISSHQLPGRQTFRSQIETFDAAWCSYLYCFVAWKARDVRSLEEGLIRAACQLELSMIRQSKYTPVEKNLALDPDVATIQSQVAKDQQLLRQKVQELCGIAGVERMESALSKTRSKRFEKESGSPTISTAHISSEQLTSDYNAHSLAAPLPTTMKQSHIEHGDKSNSVVSSLFVAEGSPPKNNPSVSSENSSILLSEDKQFVEDEILINEIIHQCGHSFVDNFRFDTTGNKEGNFKAKVKETMEKAFWDIVMESLTRETPDHSYVIELVKEIRDELCGMVPKSWKEKILDNLDLDILSQVLKTGTDDVSHLGRILEYALGILLKLSAPANEVEIKRTHERLLAELAEIVAQKNDKTNSSFVTAVVKGLRFVLEQIEVLQKEISRARIQMIEPFIRGPAGVMYLQREFTNRHGAPSDAATTLTRTAQWISSTRESLSEWKEHSDMSMATAQTLVPATALRSGGNISSACSSDGSSMTPYSSSQFFTGGALPECKGETVDLLVRLGLLKLVRRMEGLTLDEIPETMELNFRRLRNAQIKFQRIIVICTSLLVLRQTLLGENPAAEVEEAVSRSAKELCRLLENDDADVGVKEIIETLVAKGRHIQSQREVMAKVLAKSVQDGDGVFCKVAGAVYTAARGVLLGGGGPGGRVMAESALRRVGGTVLTDQLVEMSEALVVLAVVSGQVHRAWYERLIQA
ncbi:unnamed protein product [Spirodela intermedia]|uniref:Uncharacterized protein n=1 Tax=Spirodela intermedia TaxID=51605 RepID=A0A7I8KHK7_SPIIN|nr:unnamed protein product [Spirodela intermedia]